MTFDAHANFAYGTVLTPPSPATSGTSLTLAAGQGALMPAAPFNATVWPALVQPTAANAEIVRVTALATDTLTIARAQEGSGARTILVGDQLAASITAKTLTDVEMATAGGDASGALGALTVNTVQSGKTPATLGSDGAVGGPGGSPSKRILYFTRPGSLAVEAGVARLPLPAAAAIVSVIAMVNTAPTGASVIVDVLKNGTTVFTTQANRPTIAASANASGAALPDVTSLAIGDYLQVNISQIGSIVAGADLTVAILVQ